MDGLYIHRIPGLTRIVSIRDGAPAHLGLEPDHRRSRLGDIYRARVTRIEAHMNAAFVSLGKGLGGFLSGADVQKLKGQGAEGKAGIRDLLHEGEMLNVQVTKDAVDGKEVRVSTSLQVAGRHLSLTPTDPAIRLSKQIKIPDQRTLLEDALTALVAGSTVGAIVQPLAQDLSAEQIVDAYNRLLALWADIDEKMQATSEPGLVQMGGGILRNALMSAVPGENIILDGWGDDDFDLGGLIDYMAPDLGAGLEKNRSGRDLFEAEGFDYLFSEALLPSVALPDGGLLHVDKTRAATLLDLDMAGAQPVGKKHDAAYRVNWAAADQVVYEIVLRGISGLILVDFLRMKGRDQQKRLADKLRRDLGRASLDAHVLGFTPAGLMEITITRSRAGMDDIMREADPDHFGARRLQADIAAFQLINKIQLEARHHRGQAPKASIDPGVAKAMEGCCADALAALRARLGLAPSWEIDKRASRDLVQIDWVKAGSA